MTSKSQNSGVPEDQARISEFLAGVYGQNIASNRRAYKKLAVGAAVVVAASWIKRRK